MADVEMKADNKPAGEEEKKEEETKIEEPTDHYYGKLTSRHWTVQAIYFSSADF